MLLYDPLCTTRYVELLRIRVTTLATRLARITETESPTAAPAVVAPALTQVFGQLKAFDTDKENISTYLERVELYLDVSRKIKEYPCCLLSLDLRRTSRSP